MVVGDGRPWDGVGELSRLGTLGIGKDGIKGTYILPRHFPHAPMLVLDEKHKGTPTTGQKSPS